MDHGILERLLADPQARLILARARKGVAAMGCAVPVHHTSTVDKPWDSAAVEKALPSPLSVAQARGEFAWVDMSQVEKSHVPQSACKLPHHTSPGGPANLVACSAAISALNGGRGGVQLPAADRQAVYNHLAAHLKDAKRTPPALESSALEATVTASLVRMSTDQSGLITTVEGALVRSGEPNLNGVLFTSSDLRHGFPSVQGSPLTWNHITGRGAYGYVDSASLLEDPTKGEHIHITGKLWTSRFPSLHQSLHDSLNRGVAALSMECRASQVACQEPGCSSVVDLTTPPDDLCDHLKSGVGSRRMVDPTFYGAGLILDGVKPGWPGASLSLSV